METADFLCAKGVKDVTLVEMLPDSPVSPLTAHGIMLRRRLGAAGAKLLFNTTVKKIEEKAAIITTDGQDRNLAPLDQVIVAVGVTPRNDLKGMLRQKDIRHFIVGDAQEPRRIIEATTEGARAAWEV
jgi:pyruvate/2-oxoglutarate dehydrogenase complex dihydrolipoamide dehydrogenase (E3) component